MSKPLYLIGDIHGDVQSLVACLEYIAINNADTPATILQVGDYGMGFYPEIDEFLQRDIPALVRGPKFRNIEYLWFRGNHDEPKISHETFGNIGDYGYLKDLGLFYVGGAYTPPFYKGPIFEGEQISEQDMEHCFDQYAELKPDLVVTHDCPEFLVNRFYPKQGDGKYANRTTKLLQDMFAFHQPKYWYFGHHHKAVSWNVLGTHFRCVATNEVVAHNPL